MGSEYGYTIDATNNKVLSSMLEANKTSTQQRETRFQLAGGFLAITTAVVVYAVYHFTIQRKSLKQLPRLMVLFCVPILVALYLIGLLVGMYVHSHTGCEKVLVSIKQPAGDSSVGYICKDLISK